MHNLNLIYFKEHKINLTDILDFQISSLDSDRFYYCQQKCIRIVNRKGTLERLLEFDHEIIGFEYLTMNDEICIATIDGSVYVYNIANDQREEVTFCEGGLAAMKFSWDQEIVVFVTNSSNIVVLNSNYDIVNEVKLSETNFGDREFITVGWGKEDTQFQGWKEKKVDRNSVESQLVQLEEINTNSKVEISWREDCEYFAVSYSGSDGQRFKVFNKEGVLQFTSENGSGLQSCISWRPSGNWIAMPEIYRNKYVITLFEKNGLKHREVLLPFHSDTELVINISWSNDSEILLIHTNEIKSNYHSLYLYTINNYHWYLKQTLKFESKITKTLWSPKQTEKKTLYVVSSNGSLYVYQWDSSINLSLGETTDDQGLVCVIDGKNLLISALRPTVIPPPMCNYTLTHHTEINFVQFIDSCTQTHPNQFLIVDAKNEILLYECVFSKDHMLRLQDVRFKGKFTFVVNETVPLKLHHFVWISEKRIAFTTDQLLYFGSLDTDSSEVIICDAFQLTDGNLGVLTSKNFILYGQYLTGKVTEFRFEGIIKESERFSINSFTEKIEVSNATDIILMKYKQNLYWNERCLATDVTSFKLINDFLVFTTLDEMKFVNLKIKESEKQMICQRKLERGSKIVHAIAKSSKIVLQLPRGNLETIHPRLLSLCIIRDYLNAKSYKKAFELMRRERINLNLFVDHDPTTFFSSIKDFITDIDNIQWINLFLSELQNIDVTKDMYPYYHQENNLLKYSFEDNQENKVKFVCQKIIEHLEKEDSTYCLPLITCFVKKGEIEKALQLIWNLKLNEENSTASTSEEAFKYLLYLVNVNDLYNIALGLYNFPLVLYVAKRTQKDPKEYVQFLQELDALEENYRRYKIDCFIKRYDKAIENISKCGEEKLQEAIQMIEKHVLYVKAISCYKSNEKCHSTICKLYGDYLRQKNKLLDASLLYERAGELGSAISCARHIMDWKRCIKLSKKQNYSADELKDLYLSLINTLKSNGRSNEAAYIAKNYLKDISLTVDILIEGHLYGEATFEASELVDNYLEGKILAHLMDYLSSLLLSIKEDYDIFLKQKSRILEVRIEKQKEQNVNSIEMEDDLDFYSDTSSMNSSRYTTTSKGTTKTSKSSKNQRKHDRKLLNLKEGNKYEELALLDSLYKLTMNNSSIDRQKHIQNILCVAFNFDLDKEAFEIQVAYKKLTSLIKNSINEIWIPEMTVSDDQPINSCVDYNKIQMIKYYSLLPMHLRFRPILNAVDFELEIFKK